MVYRNDIKDVRSQCQIVVFPWKHETIVDSLSFQDLAKSSPIDVSFGLTSCSYSKSLSDPAGSFSFSLANTRDWKRLIKPGQWCLIYMSNDGDLAIPKDKSLSQSSLSVSNDSDLLPPSIANLQAQAKSLRCIGYIERVSVRGVMSDDGSFDGEYIITGRDFGVIYEDTQIWFNYFLFEAARVEAALGGIKTNALQTTVDQLLKLIHGLFFSPTDFDSLKAIDVKKSAKNQQTVAQVGTQWLMPKELLDAVGLKLRSGKRDTFYGHIDGLLNLEETKCTSPVNDPAGLLSGNAWEKLKSHSIQQFNELFTELDDSGKPKLNFRPIPWKLSGKHFPLIKDTIEAFIDLDRVELDPIEVVDFDLGEDNHGRYNHFLTTVVTSLFKPEENIAQLDQPGPSGATYPRVQINSVARHGFRPMHCEINTLFQLGYKDNVDKKILLQFNEMMFEYWNNAIFFESGDVDVIGRPDVRVGKVLYFKGNHIYNKEKIFYIEGYSDNFTVGENGAGSWTQSLQITRGAEVDTLKQLSNPPLKDSALSLTENIGKKKLTLANKNNSFDDDGEATGNN